MTPADRILDLALRELVGGERPPDVLERVMHATRRPRLLRGARRGWPRLPLLIAAAAVVVAVVAVLFRPEPRAGWPRDAATGEAIAVPAERSGPLRVLYDENVAFTLDEGARAKLRSADATLLRGRATVRGPLRVATARGVVVFPEGSEGEAILDDEFLTVRVAVGSAQVGDRTVERNGTLKLPEQPVPALPPAQAREIDTLVRALAADRSDEQRWMHAMKSAAELHFLLRTDAARRAYARPKLVALLPAKAPDVELRVLELLAHDPSERRRVTAAVEADPARFELDTILLLAEAGVAAAHQEVARRVAAAGESFEGVRPAVYLALRGDARARPTLRWFLGATPPDRNPDLYFAAAAGLRELGEGDWDAALDFARRRMETLLEANQVLQAAYGILHLEYFGPREGIAVAYLPDNLGDWTQERIGALDAPQKIRARFSGIEKR